MIKINKTEEMFSVEVNNLRIEDAHSKYFIVKHKHNSL